MYLSKWREHLNIVRYVLRIINVEIWLHPNLIVQCRSFVDAFVHVWKKSEKRIFSNDGNPQSKFAFFWKRLVWIKTSENHNKSSLIKICELQEKWWCFYVIVCFLNICSFGKSCENQTKNELREQNDICHCVPFEQSTGYTFCNEWMKRAIIFHITYLQPLFP